MAGPFYRGLEADLGVWAKGCRRRRGRGRARARTRAWRREEGGANGRALPVGERGRGVRRSGLARELDRPVGPSDWAAGGKEERRERREGFWAGLD